MPERHEAQRPARSHSRVDTWTAGVEDDPLLVAALARCPGPLVITAILPAVDVLVLDPLTRLEFETVSLLLVRTRIWKHVTSCHIREVVLGNRTILKNNEPRLPYVTDSNQTPRNCNLVPLTKQNHFQVQV